ncbi:MAG: class I SAM-dependent methyltransferase [Myxococcales bacterium]|nr:class I SAM-dependent methyltransferase [Myxococcales bacterium]
MKYRNRIYERYASLGGTATLPMNERELERWFRALDFHFGKLLPIQKNARILEVACGQGSFLHYLKRRGFTHLTGVDISPEQIELARRVCENVHLEDASSFLARHEGSFDLVVGFDIIEHFQKDEAVAFMDRVHGALATEGRLLLTTPNGSHIFSEPRYYDFTHEICFTPHSMSQLLGVCGFEPVAYGEGGPAPVSPASAVRYALWRGVVRPLIRGYNFVEQGHGGSGVYTRNFIVSARKT